MNDSPSWAAESFWSFDADKAAHVLVIADDLTGYSAVEPFGGWIPSFADAIEDRMVEVRERLHASMPGVESVFHLVVIQGIGRQWLVALTDRAQSPNSGMLLVEQSDLAVVARFETGDPVALWKFAQARAQLREDTMIQAWSTLDEYGVYRGARHSFYLGDDKRPTGLFISTDYGADLRFEDAQRFDVHGVPHWDSSGIVEVQRVWKGSDAPIYAPDPLTHERIEFMIETGSGSIWIFEGVEPTDDSNMRHLYFEFCDAIAYWTGQALESLGPTLAGLAEVFPTICVRVVVEDSGKWDIPQNDMDTADWLKLESSEEAIEVKLFPAAQTALGGPDNAGERELLAKLAESLVLMAEGVGSTVGDVDVAALVDRHAPLGAKKKIMFLDSSANLRLHPGDLPPTRVVQDVDVEAVIDAAGPAVVEILGLGEGPIPGDKRVEVFNAIVEYYFDELCQTIARLTPEGLLEWLVACHEALVQTSASQRLTLPTQLACFGSEPEYLAEIQGRLDDLTRADQSLRFLIEYATAQPPSGTMPMNLTTFDRLMAVSNEIINKGMLSDAVQYGLADVELSILPSGRLGIDREGRYMTGVEAFRPVHARHDTQAAHDYFENHWTSREQDVGQTRSTISMKL